MVSLFFFAFCGSLHCFVLDLGCSLVVEPPSTFDTVDSVDDWAGLLYRTPEPTVPQCPTAQAVRDRRQEKLTEANAKESIQGQRQRHAIQTEEMNDGIGNLQQASVLEGTDPWAVSLDISSPPRAEGRNKSFTQCSRRHSTRQQERSCVCRCSMEWAWASAVWAAAVLAATHRSTKPRAATVAPDLELSFHE